jgi:hypothetical protein
MGWLRDPRLEVLLDRLHAQSAAQSEELTSYFMTRAKEGSLTGNEFDEQSHRFMSDKLVALDRDKAQFCYQLPACEAGRRGGNVLRRVHPLPRGGGPRESA